MTDGDKIPVKMTRKQIRAKAEDFVSSRHNANNLVDVLNLLKDGQCSGKNIVTSILALETMLVHALRCRALLEKKKKLDSEAEQAYDQWLLQQYEATIVELLSTVTMATTEQAAREQAVVTYMKLLTADSQYMNKPRDEADMVLPRDKFYALLKVLVTPRKGCDNSKLLARFKEFSCLHDVALQTWLSCERLAKPGVKPRSEVAMRNLLTLMNGTEVPTSKLRAREPDQLLLPKRGAHWPLKSTDRRLTKCLDVVWSHVKAWPHTKATLHLTLLLLLEKVMDVVSKPVLLTDFFMAALDAGGAVSLLALQGIFNLIQKHNIDYPNIYTKLYSLFTPGIFTTKYKARLFYLADLFLTSTHLPEALVASFAKRLARLSLLAPAPDILVILPFIGNLLLRHKGLQRLAQHPEGGKVDKDPFLDKETDPMLTCAMDSSLWEIKSLQMHVLPSVAIAARFIDEKMPSVEWELADVLEGSYKQMFEKELNKKAKEITLTFERPHPDKLARENWLRVSYRPSS